MSAMPHFFPRKLSLALAIAFVASIAQADAIPLPKPAPKSRDMQMAASDPANPRTPPAAIGAPVSAPTTPQGSEATPDPIIPNLRKLFGIGSNAPAAPAFDANQKALADKVSAYLSSLQNVSGNFVQVGPDGSRTTGNFYLQKPGRIRFEYDDPSPIALVADGTSVIVRDRKLATQDVYPLSQTPLRYLLADRLNLLRDTNVTGITADDVYISVTIEEKQALIGTSRLTLMIGAKDSKLKQWTVTDPQGYDTTVAVYNLDTTKKLDPALFKIDYTNYQGGSN
jgi:outer membrane lipoprotein-sorting protein